MRENIERYFDKYNHLMEFIRTMTGITVLVLQTVILLRIFNII
jgi:flagellar capping protein FliD